MRIASHLTGSRLAGLLLASGPAIGATLAMGLDGTRSDHAVVAPAVGEVGDRVAGLRAGGDDYLPKPFSFQELAARLEVIVRRRAVPDLARTKLTVGDLRLHHTRRCARLSPRPANSSTEGTN